ncbi:MULTISPECIES: hypothetical protein [Halorussus]|uniref:hypothetical protein n=1 Tax=Halorussus TaxID=1070314 RepID=UPI000E21623A|nr:MULTISPECIES: hypothetical protein [Halorussus]NHN59450.1 hypothetical protein [Halorussus sp. JP-T4]
MQPSGKLGPVPVRVPVSGDFWRAYGVPLGFVLVALSTVSVAAASDPGRGVVVGATFLGLSVGAVAAGLVVYNVVVALLLAAMR